MLHHAALLPIQSYMLNKLAGQVSPFKVEANTVPNAVGQTKKCVKNIAIRDQFLNKYGRHISLFIDEIDYELINEDTKSAIAAGLISTLLEENVGLILTNITVWYHAIIKQHITAAHMHQWDAYTNHESLLLVPKALQTKAGRIEHGLGLDLTDFKLIPHPTMMYDCKDFESLHECLLPLRKLCSVITRKTSIVTSFKSLMLDTSNDEMKHKAPWSVCVNGHGRSSDDLDESSICGMTAHQFKGFLQYIHAHIAIKIVVYHSCCAGSKTNLIDLYYDNQLPYVYNFPIVCSSFSNGVATVSADAITDKQINYDMKKFLQTMRHITIVPENAQKIFNAVALINNARLENFSHIRWAGYDHFQLLALKDSDAAYILHENNSHPSQINYILTKAIIDEAIVFDNKESFTFVESGMPQCMHHYIKQIHLPKSKGFDDLFVLFLYIVSKEYRNKDPKVYLIESATCAKNKAASNIIIYLRTPSACAWDNQLEFEMFFEQEGSCYVAHVANAQICLGDVKNNIYPAIKIEKLSELQAISYRASFAQTKEKLLVKPYCINI